MSGDRCTARLSDEAYAKLAVLGASLARVVLAVEEDVRRTPRRRAKPAHTKQEQASVDYQTASVAVALGSMYVDDKMWRNGKGWAR